MMSVLRNHTCLIQHLLYPDTGFTRTEDPKSMPTVHIKQKPEYILANGLSFPNTSTQNNPVTPHQSLNH